MRQAQSQLARGWASTALFAALALAGCGGEPEPVEIEIDPSGATVAAGTQEHFTATGIDGDGERIAVAPEWRVTGEVGAIDADGVFTARTPGDGEVIATAGEIEARATVTVTPGAPASLTLEAGPERLEAASEASIMARVTDAQGNPVPDVEVELSTETDGASLAEPEAKTGPDGMARGTLRLAKRAGENRVVARAGELSAEALVSGAPGEPAALEAVARPARVLSGERASLEVRVSDAHGNPLGGVEVAFEVAGAGASLSEAAAVTRADGIAKSELTTRSEVGENRVEVSAGGITIRTVAVEGVRLARIEVAPKRAAVAAGSGQSFAAKGFDETGSELPVVVHWGVTGAIGTIDGSGKFVGAETGTGTVVATQRNVTGTADVAVTAGPLESIRISPGEATLVSGSSVRFSCRGVDVAGNEVAVEPEWRAPAELGAVDREGVFTAAKVGKGKLTAEAKGARAEAVVVVTPGALARLRLEPEEISLPAGNSRRFEVSGEDRAGNEVPVAPTWTVSGEVGETSQDGTFRAVAAGSGQLVVVAENVAARARIEVTPGELTEIEIRPAEAEVSSGNSIVLSAIGRDAHGNELEVEAEWSATAEVGTIDAAGRFTGVAAGKGEVVATSGSVAGTADLSVVPGRLARLELTPEEIELVAGATGRFQVAGFDQAGNSKPLQPDWAVEGELGEIGADGALLARRAGSGRVTASAEGLTASAEVTVEPAALASVSVTPESAKLRAGEVQEFEASGRDAFGNDFEIDPAWTTTGSVGSVDAETGAFTALRSGRGRVIATVGPIGGEAAVDVERGDLATIVVTPSPTVEAGQTAAFTAVGRDAHGNAVPISPGWSVTGDVGRIDDAGLFTARSAGKGEVVATVGDVGGTTSVSVVPGPLAAVDVSPAEASVVSAETLQFSALGRDALGNAVEVTARWAVEGEVGSIDESGLFTAALAGHGVVRAVSGSAVGEARIEVVPGEVQTIAVRPDSAQIALAETLQFAATGLDRARNEREIEVEWSVTAGIGEIDASGLFTAANAGEGKVLAVYEGRVGSASVTATPGVLAALRVQPPAADVSSGETLEFRAEGRDAAGNPIADLEVRWKTSGEIGSIDPASGLFTAVAAGEGRVVAASGGIEAEAMLSVRPGQPSAGRSRVSVSPESVPADGASAVLVTVVVRDRFNNPVPGVPVSVRSSRAGDGIVLDAETSDASGMLTARVTSATPGRAVLTVTAGGITLASEIVVEFDATSGLGG